ncbi:unnamed protein product, partial [Pylaiella littoralis]
MSDQQGVDPQSSPSGDQRVAKNYILDDHDTIRFLDTRGRKLIAIPQTMISDILALVHGLHGHAGVGATLTLVRDRFH